MKPKRKVISFSVLPQAADKLNKASFERDIPRSVLIREMLNFAVKQGFNL